MTLRVTNTLTGETEPFEPRDPDSVLLYYCGLTTSDPPHLGHARGWVHVERSGGGGVVDDAGAEPVVEERALADGVAGSGGE